MKVAHLDSPMMGQQKYECSVVEWKSCWRREQEVWALSSGRFTRRDDLDFDQCLSIQDGRSLVLLVAILGLPLVLCTTKIQGPTVWANHHATTGLPGRHHLRHGTVAMTTVAMTIAAMTTAIPTLSFKSHAYSAYARSDVALFPNI